jgi:hypothetical protein
MRAIMVALPMQLRAFSLLLTLLYTVTWVPLLHCAHYGDEDNAHTRLLPLSIPGQVPYLKGVHSKLSETDDEDAVRMHHLPLSTPGRAAPSTRQPDGTFNGFDLFKVDKPPHTDIQCIGENFQEERSYMFRSCRFETFCFDTQKMEFVVYPDRPLNATLYEEIWSSTHNPENYTAVVPGAMNRNWWPVYWNEEDGMKSRIGKYRPKFVYADSGNVPTSYYRFDATWLPFYRHQRSPYNPGHLVWDDFLALYTLLDIFDQADDKFMLTHMVRKAFDDFSGDEPLPDSDIIRKFLPLLGDHPYGLQTLEGEFDLKLKDGDGVARRDKKRHVICADNGLLGNGMFTGTSGKRVFSLLNIIC